MLSSDTSTLYRLSASVTTLVFVSNAKAVQPHCTPDEVKLTTVWPQGPRNYQVFWEKCEYYTTVLKQALHSNPSQSSANHPHPTATAAARKQPSTKRTGSTAAASPTQTASNTQSILHESDRRLQKLHSARVKPSRRSSTRIGK